MTDLYVLPQPASFGRTASGTAWSRYGAGSPVVLIHGVGMCQDFWAPQVHELMADHEVICYDMWGHGRSTVDPDATTLTDYSHQLDDLLTALGLRAVHLVGHSLGALVALQFAIEHPDTVLSLTVLNAVFQRSDAQRAPVLRRAHALAQDGTMEVDKTLLRWFGEPGDHPHTEAETLCRRLLAAVDARGYSAAYLVFAEAEQDSSQIAGLRCPASFATGQDDPNSTPEMTRALAAAVPKSRAEVFAGQRHMMSLTIPHEVSDLIRATVARAAG